MGGHSDQKNSVLKSPPDHTEDQNSNKRFLTPFCIPDTFLYPSEILVQLEAHGDVNDARWKVNFSRLGSAELHVLLDGKEFWSAPRTPNVVGKPSDPYWLMLYDEK